MANIQVKDKLVTVEELGAAYNAGVTGVKGSAESTYRTGQVNLTAANVGAVSKSGDTMTGHLVINRGSNYSSSVQIISGNGQEIRLWNQATENHGLYSTGYYNGSTFVSDDKWIINRGTNGKVAVADHYNKDEIDNYGSGAGFHNSIFRGKYLGTSLTAAQSAQIQAGTFDDLFIGDYWTINGIKYVIADFDPYYRCGENISLGHHIAVIPASNMVSAAWNVGSNDTSKMYVKSDIRIVTIQGGTSGGDPNVDSTSGVQGTIISAFGASHVLKYRALYPSAQSNGKATSWAWVDARVELLNEVEVYGTQAWTAGGNGNGFEIGINKRQLAIFHLDPTFANIRAYWWLRSVHSAAYACFVDSDGFANSYGASTSLGVRPLSLIA